MPEMKFNDPPVCIGLGTFGLVLLAEYEGTQVAVKRVIPPQGISTERKAMGSMIRRLSMLGGGGDAKHHFSYRDGRHVVTVRL